jgi:acyl-coenzyme A thioesterase PaaI-like protein
MATTVRPRRFAVDSLDRFISPAPIRRRFAPTAAHALRSATVPDSPAPSATGQISAEYPDGRTTATVDCLFRRSDGSFVPQPVTRGPWDHGAQHGGAVCGLVAWVMEQAAQAHRPGLVLSRLTVELWRSVPVEPLVGLARVVRPGRRVAVIDVELRPTTAAPVDPPLVRAHGQWVAAGRVAVAPASTANDDNDHDHDDHDDHDDDERDMDVPPPRPLVATDPSAGDFAYPRPGFNCDAVELRPVSGNTEEPGPGTVWARLRVPVVGGHPATPLQQVATLADLGGAVGWDRSPSGAAFINPDLTLQLARYPIGPWICFRSRTVARQHGLGYCETALIDDRGRFGWVLQSLVESPYELGIIPDLGASAC